MTQNKTTRRDDELREKYPVITDPTRDQLTDKQLLDYEQHRLDFLYWLETVGKNPGQLGDTAYSHGVVENTAYRTDKWFRFIWQKEEAYTLNVTHDHGDDYLHHLNLRNDVAYSHGKATESALKRYYKWLHHEHGQPAWEPTKTFRGKSTSHNPQDGFEKEERPKLRDAALDYSSTPAYNDLSPKERDRWKATLAQKLGKPKDEITPADFERREGWKVASLVAVSLDAGLRPSEVEVAHTGWLDLENNLLRIPKEDSRKNTNNWTVALTSRTGMWLEEWLHEREAYPEYDDTDLLWLTREGNPYTSQSLRYLIRRICKEAGISTEKRKISWYSLRHSVGTHMVTERDLKTAKDQLRHNSPYTTMKYDHAPTEEVRKALERMG